jgi:hypothetical protein
MSHVSTRPAIHGVRSLAAILCVLSLPWMVPAALARAEGLSVAPVPPAEGSSAAALVQCATAAAPGERSATFSGEMTALPGTVRMAMRIEVLERAPGETSFHAVVASGLGVWRAAEPNVKVYKYLKQVANLSAPAVYRAAIVFRWQGPHWHTIKRAEHLTHVCHQTAPATVPTEPPSAATPLTPAAG